MLTTDIEENTGREGEIISAELTEEEVANLEMRDDIIAVEEDIQFCANGISQNQKDELNEWNIELIHADEIKGDTTGNKVKVAIIDSGVDMSDEIVVEERVNLIPEEKDISPLYEDTTGHGTSVAGIIAAQDNGKGITGINPNVELYSVKVLDKYNTAPLSRVLEGIYWAIEHDMDIINMSFGTNVYSEILEAAIQDASDAGILMIAASGNTGEESIDYPAAFEEVISVGSVDAQGQICENSSGGSSAELLAPGDAVRTSSFFGGTIIASGSSIAAPHVTGVASLIWQKDLEKSPEYIRKILGLSANDLNGIIDASYALDISDNLSENELNDGDVKIEKNMKPLPEVDNEGYVTGTWGKGGHYDLITENINISDGSIKLTNQELQILKLASAAPDLDEYRKLDTYSVMHGQKNYVAVARFLFRVSYNFFYMPDSEFSASKAQDEWFFAKEQNAAIKSDLQKIMNKIRAENALGLGEKKTRRNSALKIMGLMFHVLGDTQAHMRVVPEVNTTSTNVTNKELGKKFYVGDFKNINQFKQEVQNSCVKFVDIKKYMTDSISSKSARYEDNRYFYSARYDDADTVITNTMVSLFDKNKTFIDDYLCMGVNPKLYKFKTYIYEAFTSVPSEYAWVINQMTIGD